MIKLNKKEKDRLEAIEWLLDDSILARQTGRTKLMAIAFINKASRNEGKPIKVFDHTGTKAGIVFLFTSIEQIIEDDNVLKDYYFQIDHQLKELTLTGKRL